MRTENVFSDCNCDYALSGPVHAVFHAFTERDPHWQLAFHRAAKFLLLVYRKQRFGRISITMT